MSFARFFGIIENDLVKGLIKVKVFVDYCP